MKPQFPVLLVGYGNYDREDDGVAWHILSRLAKKLDSPFFSSPDEFEFIPGGKIDVIFTLQLIPEMAETISRYARICFIDAHTGAVPDEVHVEEVFPSSQKSPFTHHLTPAMLLSYAETLYHRHFQAIVVSVRGYHFGFSRQLSAPTGQSADLAVDRILSWIGPS